MEETTEFAVHAGMFPTSMKVFRISGRDRFRGAGRPLISPCLNESLPHKRKRRGGPHHTSKCLHASMKVFRISGRDVVDTLRDLDVDRLNESLPHKRKRPRRLKQPVLFHLRLNESLPHKRKRHAFHRVTAGVSNDASMKVFRISGRDSYYVERSGEKAIKPQ